MYDGSLVRLCSLHRPHDCFDNHNPVMVWCRHSLTFWDNVETLRFYESPNETDGLRCQRTLALWLD